jgi:type IV fimbrial biogenesis protein FimT
MEQHTAAMSRPARGFTLIELLVTLTILAVVMALVVPSFKSAFLGNSLASYTNSWVASAQLAKSEAIKRGAAAQVVLCRSTDGAACATSGTWQQGWIVCVDANANATCDSGETIVFNQASLSADYHFTSTSYAIVFRPTGMVTSTDVLTLCRATPEAGTQERQITLLITGRVSVATTHAGACT